MLKRRTVRRFNTATQGHACAGPGEGGATFTKVKMISWQLRGSLDVQPIARASSHCAGIRGYWWPRVVTRSEALYLFRGVYARA